MIVKKFILILSIVIIVYGLVVPKNEYANISIQNDIFIDVPNRDNMENYAKLKDKYPAFSKMNLVDFVNMKKYKKIIIFLPVLFVWFTALASPVFCEPRYVYSMFTCLPLFIGIAVNNKKI